MIGKMETAIRNALDRWEPRIDVEDIDFDLVRRRRRPARHHDQLPGPGHQPPAQPRVSLLRDPRRGARVAAGANLPELRTPERGRPGFLRLRRVPALGGDERARPPRPPRLPLPAASRRTGPAPPPRIGTASRIAAARCSAGRLAAGRGPSRLADAAAAGPTSGRFAARRVKLAVEPGGRAVLLAYVRNQSDDRRQLRHRRRRTARRLVECRAADACTWFRSVPAARTSRRSRSTSTRRGRPRPRRDRGPST